jgi:hypothetical protein
MRGERLRIDVEGLRRHYESLSDEALLELDRSQLVEMAQKIYDEEIGRRDLDLDAEVLGTVGPDEEGAGDDAGEWEAGGDGAPDWLEDAACACAFTMHPGHPDTTEVEEACAALRDARIPCHVVVNDIPAPGGGRHAAQQEYCVMVPGALNLHAASVLDRDLFNARHEADWRHHLATLTDDDLLALRPEVFTAGLRDRIVRLEKAYAAEVTRRALK